MPNETACATFYAETSRMKNGITDSPVAARVMQLAAAALDEKDVEIARLRRLWRDGAPSPEAAHGSI